MSEGTTSCRIVKENALQFLTFSTVNWIDVFSGKNYRDNGIESLQWKDLKNTFIRAPKIMQVNWGF